jgi:AraC family transcriptional regulator of adaptative response / DNA-3-methyladenine glycosylase II
MRRTIRLMEDGQETSGWFDVRFDTQRSLLNLQVSDSLVPVLPVVIARVKAQFDLDADTDVIDSVLMPHFTGGSGMRVPGAVDGFELAVRAVLGQQITVAAARTLAQRLVEALGDPIETPWPTLTRLFPSARVLANVSGDWLGQLGIVRPRQAAIVALAQAVHSGTLRLLPGEDAERTMATLRALPGIGDWTAQYIAMRALRWPDAFPAADVALHAALKEGRGASATRRALAASEAWRPWGSYAVMRVWAGFARIEQANTEPMEATT